MKVLIVLGALLLACVSLGAMAYKPMVEYVKKRNQPSWRVVDVTEGEIVAVVNATGEVKPVLSVQVGSVVSGLIKELHGEFNQEVKEGEILAVIDTRIYDAACKRDRAALATSIADVKRVQSELKRSENEEKRSLQLRKENKQFVSDTEMDQLKFTRESWQAQVEIARAAVDRANAALDDSQTNLELTKIRAPMDGVIIDRKVEHGQTVTAAFQTPELFTMAPDLRKEVYVHVSVDEADIGMIRKAREEGRTVRFTVDAYPHDLFEGTIKEIRLSSTSKQNVVTYPVVVSAANPDLKLLPGMTATVSFQVDYVERAIKIPNSALRFYPEPEQVREADRELLEGGAGDTSASNPQDGETASAAERTEARRLENRRHVWVVDGDWLRAVEVTIGLNDSRNSQLVAGDLKVGDQLVIGLKPKKKSSWSS